MEDYDARGEGFSRSMAGELAMHLALLNNPAKLVRDLSTASTTDVPEGQRHRMIEYLKQARSLKEEQDYLETTSQQLLSARKEAFPGRLKVVADLMRQRVTEATDRGLLLNVWLSDGLDKHVNREARCLANLRLAMTAVTLEQFRASHNNRYPAGLSELTPSYLNAVLTDPFDGQPLRYRKQDAGYVLYSIGPDLKDDGGKPMNGKGGDIVFTVVTPPAP